MCGICGVVQLRGEPREVVRPEVLARMTDALRHRGPDDWGSFVEDGVALGVRRLSIVDIDGGHQPFANEDGSVVAVQNGELYNHRDVRRQLEREGHVFRSLCDTEIIPHLYERHGAEFPRQLRGMFGIAAWDGGRRRAVLARDRLGIKPLYYAECGDLLVFASELKSLLASGLVAPEVDLEAIDAYLTLGFVPAPMTPLRGVSKLLPGHVLVAEGGRISTVEYWQHPAPDPLTDASEDELGDALLELLDESVRMRLMSDVPLGAMLSGGLDSSLVVALMARRLGTVQTFAVGFKDGSNELDYARRVASVFETEHHELELGAVAPVDLAELVWHVDEPVADLSALGFFALSGLAAQHVTVALSGQGADELLGGYQKYRAAAAAAQWRRLPAVVRLLPERLGSRAPGRAGRLVRTLAAGDAVERLVAMSGPGGARRALGGHTGGTAIAAVRDRIAGGTGNPLADAMYLDAQLALPDDMLHYFDRASMAHSLEVRVPFLDHELVELCARIPTSMKARWNVTKYLLKRAARGTVPDWVIDRPKVGFFNAGAGAWLRAQSSCAIADHLLGDRLAVADILDTGELRKLVLAQRAGRTDKWEDNLLLAVLMLEVWMSTYIPRAVGTSSVPAARPAA